MSRFADKCYPFFHVLQRREDFTSNQEAEEAFHALKTYLAQLPKIASPLAGETLLIYPAILEHAVSAALIVKQAKEQLAVYYVSHALLGAEANYPIIEKFAYALVMTSWKL